MVYTKKYFSYYLTQFLAIFLNIFSVALVIPRLASFPEQLGIYMLAVSLLNYLAYGDFGFLVAGTKFATEAYAQNNRRELEYTGFVMAFSLATWVLFGLFILGFLYFYEHVKLVSSPAEIVTFFRNVMLTLLAFSPVMAVRRVLQTFFSIRLEDYYFRLFFSIGSVFKIISAFFLVHDHPSGVYHYFLFGNVVDLLLVIYCFYFICHRYNYTLGEIIRHTKFDKKIYNEVKGLAFSTLFSTFCWVAFFELDSLFIATFGNLTQVGLIAVCLLLVGYVRMLMGTFFSPFAVRFNHFTGLKDFDGLKKYCLELIEFSFPFSILFITIVVLLLKPLFASWTGGFEAAILCTAFYLLSFIFSFIQYPGGFLLISLEKNKAIAKVGFLSLIVFWICILLFFRKYGLVTIGVAKFLCFFMMFIFYQTKILEFAKETFSQFFLSKWIKILIAIAVIMFVDHYFQSRFLINLTKSYQNLTLVVTTGVVYLFIGIFVYYILCKEFADVAKKIFASLKEVYLLKRVVK